MPSYQEKMYLIIHIEWKPFISTNKQANWRHCLIQIMCNASLSFMLKRKSYINYIFFCFSDYWKIQKSKVTPWKEDTEKCWSITVGLYIKLEELTVYLPHSSDPTYISNSLSTGCLQIEHLSVWNLESFAHPLHIHCKYKMNPANAYQGLK